MLLRSVTRHLRDQNWSAVGLDFLIVVVGVFIGIQVANWNEARLEREQTSQQLVNLKTEMESNLRRIAAHDAWCDEQLEIANTVRQILSEDVSRADARYVDAGLLTLQSIRTFVPELNAYRELAETGGLRRLRETPLRDALAQWQEVLASVQRMDRDALVYRDDVRAAYLSTSISLAALLEHYPRSEGKIAPSRFRNDLHAMADDLRLDNFLAMRAAFSAGIPTYLDEFTEQTRAVILLLENYIRPE